MADIFGREPLQISTPLTADKCIIYWEGEVDSAVNVSIEYSQQVTRRRSIGNNKAVVYGSQPQGRISIGRLLTTTAGKFAEPAWTCGSGDSVITLTTRGCDGEGGQTYRCAGCVVTSYSIQVEAEGLTVVDNVVIEFLELSIG